MDLWKPCFWTYSTEQLSMGCSNNEEGWLWPIMTTKNLMKDAYPFPLICKIMDSLSNSWIFSKLDIWWGFHNIWIKKSNKSKAAFTCPLRQFEPMVMQFRMANAPSSFQCFMDNIGPFHSNQTPMWPATNFEPNRLSVTCDVQFEWNGPVYWLRKLLPDMSWSMWTMFSFTQRTHSHIRGCFQRSSISFEKTTLWPALLSAHSNRTLLPSWG